jgi:Ca-activated chloride channel family protein
LIAWYVFRRATLNPTIRFSDSKPFLNLKKPLKIRLRHLPFGIRMLALSLMIVALARPQSSNEWETVNTEGIDIMITLDISGSMLAQDFQPDRLEAAKEVASEFIAGRPNDRIGLVVFSGESFTQCPLTTDHAVLLNLFNSIHSGMIEDGTAIGSGLANAVNRIKDSDAISRVIILLTDGVNNTGSVAPLTAAELARTFGIRVYTIGVGSEGMAPYPVSTPFGVRLQNMETKIDENVLRNIASMTGGLYFRATDNAKLKSIYQEIDQLEKSKISVQEHHKKQDQYFFFVFAAALLLMVELFLRYLYYKILS